MINKMSVVAIRCCRYFYLTDLNFVYCNHYSQQIGSLTNIDLLK